MTVAQLIAYLQTQPQDMLVVLTKYSDRSLLDEGDMHIVKACAPRSDGWVQNERPDMPSQNYLCIEGN